MKVKEESEQVSLKLSIQKPKIMASNAITSWQIDGEKIESVIDFFSWALKSLLMVTAVIKLRSWHPVPSPHGKQKEKKWKQGQILFSWAPKSLQMVTAPQN